MHKAGWFDRNQMRVLKASLVAVFVLMVLGGAYISHEIRGATQRADASATAVQKLSKNLDSSRKQLIDHGIKPSAPSAKTIVEQVGGVPGATGAPGKNGATGVSGQEGTQGKPGPSGPPGSPGSPGTNGVGSPGAAGETGAPGIPGTNGVDGKDGAPGAAGQDGKDGTNGKDGSNGQPPAGWTYTDPAGVPYTCSPVSGFDPASPRYACTADTATAPTSSNAGFLASGEPASPSRRQEMPVMMSVAYAIVSERKRL
jgi:hypothetical protein